MKGEHDKAIENFDKALHLDPSNRDAIRNRATALLIKKILLHEMPLHDALKAFGATKGQRQYVDALEINSVGYDESAQTLEIEFRGRKVYRYSDVPASVCLNLMNAESMGDFFEENIRNVYSYFPVSEYVSVRKS